MGEKGVQARRPGFGFTCTTRVLWFDVIVYKSGSRINRQTGTQNRVQKLTQIHMGIWYILKGDLKIT